MAGLSLIEFVQKQRRAECAVCSLPDEVRQQMAKASDRKIKRATVLAWLREEHKIEIADAILTTHYSAKHDA